MTSPFPPALLDAIARDAALIVAEVANTVRPYAPVPTDPHDARKRYEGYQNRTATPKEGRP